MFYALLTALCWSFAGFGSSRISRHFGAAPANGLRLVFSTLLLSLWLAAAKGWDLPPGALWFALGGILHLAIGDAALFAAYRRLGPRLGVLMVASLSPPSALWVEWMMRGTTLSLPQFLCAAGVMLSVVFAVAPRERMHLSPAEMRVGVMAGVLAALGQGAGLAFTRMGYGQAEAVGVVVSPVLAAGVRVAAGTLGIGFWILLLKLMGGTPLKRPVELIPHKRVQGHPWMWMAVSAGLGPFLGMIFLMKASETTPSALVQATLATLPILVMPIAWWLDGNAPSKRSAFAGLLAVLLTLCLVRLG